MSNTISPKKPPFSFKSKMQTEVSHEDIELATKEFIKSGGKIKRLPPGNIFTLVDLESLYESKDSVKRETSRYKNQRSSG